MILAKRAEPTRLGEREPFGEMFVRRVEISVIVKNRAEVDPGATDIGRADLERDLEGPLEIRDRLGSPRFQRATPRLVNAHAYRRRSPTCSAPAIARSSSGTASADRPESP